MQLIKALVALSILLALTASVSAFEHKTPLEQASAYRLQQDGQAGSGKINFQGLNLGQQFDLPREIILLELTDALGNAMKNPELKIAHNLALLQGGESPLPNWYYYSETVMPVLMEKAKENGAKNPQQYLDYLALQGWTATRVIVTEGNERPIGIEVVAASTAMASPNDTDHEVVFAFKIDAAGNYAPMFVSELWKVDYGNGIETRPFPPALEDPTMKIGGFIGGSPK